MSYFGWAMVSEYRVLPSSSAGPDLVTAVSRPSTNPPLAAQGIGKFISAPTSQMQFGASAASSLNTNPPRIPRLSATTAEILARANGTLKSCTDTADGMNNMEIARPLPSGERNSYRLKSSIPYTDRKNMEALSASLPPTPKVTDPKGKEVKSQPVTTPPLDIQKVMKSSSNTVPMK